MPSCSAPEALYPELAELAVQSHDQRTFREAWISRVSRAFGADSATSSSTSDGRCFASVTINVNLRHTDLAEYLAEIRPHEAARLLEGRTVLDDYVFQERFEHLKVYREFLIPNGMFTAAVRGWLSRGRIFLTFLAKHRGTKPFEADDLKALDILMPVIALGEAMHAEEGSATTQHASALLGQVTAAERTVVTLAQRGMTNGEISQVTGTSPSTVRNQLASVYGKLGVRNRTELTFLLSGIEEDPNAVRGVPPTELARVLAQHTSGM